MECKRYWSITATASVGPRTNTVTVLVLQAPDNRYWVSTAGEKAWDEAPNYDALRAVPTIAGPYPRLEDAMALAEQTGSYMAAGVSDGKMYEEGESVTFELSKVTT